MRKQTILASVILLAIAGTIQSAELHIYATGGHGYGLRRTDMPVTRWPERAEDWLRNQKLMERE